MNSLQNSIFRILKYVIELENLIVSWSSFFLFDVAVEISELNSAVRKQ